jgi:hypothetical protein
MHGGDPAVDASAYLSDWMLGHLWGIDGDSSFIGHVGLFDDADLLLLYGGGADIQLATHHFVCTV